MATADHYNHYGDFVERGGEPYRADRELRDRDVRYRLMAERWELEQCWENGNAELDRAAERETNTEAIRETRNETGN